MIHSFITLVDQLLKLQKSQDLSQNYMSWAILTKKCKYEDDADTRVIRRSFLREWSESDLK